MEIDTFTEANAPKEGSDGFQKENKRLVDSRPDGTTTVKAGLIVAAPER